MEKTNKKIVNANDDCCFWSCDGSISRNLDDLRKSLLKMNKESFIYHVNEEKNDFSIWIEEILKDKVLAKKLRNIKTIKTTIKTIEKRLK